MVLNRCLILFALFLSKSIAFSIEADDPDTFNYKDHPCKRTCKEGWEERKTCRYIFVVERYTTMSKACYDCPKNETDCSRPHCIVADGVPKLIYSVNRQLPGPTIEVCENDEIEVELRNQMLSESTTIHWHGFKQLLTGYMDGVPYVTQCPILPGQNFTYKFHATTTGTFFYHGHIGNQKADGLFGALIVHRITEIEQIKKLDIHDEYTVVLNDWSHRTADENIVMGSHVGSSLVSLGIDSILINGLGSRGFKNESEHSSTIPGAKFTVTQGKNYRFRVIGAASDDCPIKMRIDKHEMKVISLDSNDIKPVTVDALWIWPGERIDFILSANQNPAHYWIDIEGNVTCRSLGHQTALLQYDDDNSLEPKIFNPSMLKTTKSLRVLNPYNDGAEEASTHKIIINNLKSLEPNDKSLNQKIPDHKIYISFDFYKIDNHDYHRRNLYGYNQVDKLQSGRTSFTQQFNHFSMKMPTVPLMSEWQLANTSSFCNATHPPENRDCEKEHCQCTHVIQLRLNSVVELVLVDEGGMSFEVNHPLHLHGHFFRVIASENLNGTVSIDRVKKLDEDGKIIRSFDRAPLKDTMKTPGGGYTIVRFLANNPGYWFFHCHFEPHTNHGMAFIFKVGEHEDFPKVPENFPKCGV